MKKLLLILISLSACLYLGFVGSVIGATENHSENEVVVLAHGLGRSDTAMWLFKRRLEDEGFAVCTLDYSSIGETVASVLEVTTKQIDQCVSDAPTVHFVGHSLGGLVSRSYLQHHPELTNSSRLGHVVLMGTPNQGSEIADHYDGSWVMEFGGEISQALVTGENSLGNQLELIDSNIGIIAGTKSMILTNDAFSGPNDGLVSVESTKLINMKDFIEIEVGHSNMRYNKEVAEQTVHFLKHGRFNH
ncbi:alpha/beta fold hydrolase [Vibrio ulleungensis]|uniref:Alpha/beta fold hydrolase n=1 Tax=Vibrio ulleungensis TaxID=2807619 RepID=A0ABS2HJR1_9VIBR|nr:alpha/beta fold hydrolase [Vibrio ulleungensis]MBM7036757.1 alpha/beta fold hydrolase [Vibrio ulleungensis]